MTARAVVCAPLKIEAARLAPALPPGMVIRTGAGPRRSRRARTSGPVTDGDAIAVVGIGGGVTPRVSTGDLVVATEVRGPGWTVACPGAALVARSLHRRGLPVHVGPITSVPHIVLRQRERERLARTGALCVDTESAWLLQAVGERPAICVRVVADAPPAPVIRPATLGKIRAALGQLSEVAGGLAEWAAAIQARTVVVSADSVLPNDVSPKSKEKRSIASLSVDVRLVVGSAAETPNRAVDDRNPQGVRTYDVRHAEDIDLRWLHGAATVGVVAGPLARQGRVSEVIGLLGALGPVEVVDGRVPGEVDITPPMEVRAP